MEDLLDFKLKKAGPNKDKVILFIIMKKENIPYNLELKNQIISKYVSMIEKHPEIYVCVDARKISSFSKKLAWEGASDLYKFNSLFSKNIRASSFLISNKNIINVIKLIEKIHPFACPTKFCKDNNESLTFLYKHMK